MANKNECALLAANSYSVSTAVVAPQNAVPLPSGWTFLDVTRTSGNAGVNSATGFLARAYTNGSEIVVAYAGTTWEDGMKSLDWTKGNIPAATASSLAEQIVDAARFYLDVRAANAGEISFTGHSLGGGLASLMAVFFDKVAYTFDEAPFERSAESDSVVNELKQILAAEYSLADLAPEFSEYVPGTTDLAREGNVQNTYVKGEVLRNFRAYVAAAATLAGGPVGGLLAIAAGLAISEIAGPAPSEIDPQATGTTATDLHDMRILTAFLQSPAFLQANRANPDFLQQLFKSPLYVDKTQNRPEHNFLNLMLQQQAAGNQALDRLAEDIGKFTGTLDPVANGFAGADDQLKSALYQLVLGLYYGEGEKRTGVVSTPFESLIKSLPGGIQFAPDRAPERQDDYRASLKAVLVQLNKRGQRRILFDSQAHAVS
ncbi:MAG: hypothetical protein WCV99_18835 [Sterolibacterium sp.]